ncbi:type II secretion system F family protein [Paenibacillus sp. MBLB4367]|uniref:type II secretion system F family protein n=1 Tax=Paenibacillus sp. MBLB4367 TaxID=3384767 RepID=UPI0039080FF0
MAAAMALFGVGYLFYKHPVAGFMLAMLSFYCPNVYRRMLIRRRKNELTRQFKQALYAISSSLSAGKSVENAFHDAASDMRMLFRDERAYIVDELDRIGRKLENGETIEGALLDLAERADLEDIRSFCDVFATCKRSGGNLMQVVRRTSDMIGERMELQQEIIVLLAQKRFESKVLVCAPAAVIALLSLSSPDYMAPLYGNATGILVMSTALGLLGGAWVLTAKMMDVKV